MRLTAARTAGPAPFEGDLTLRLHGLPLDAVVTSARLTVAPAAPIDPAAEPFTYGLLATDPAPAGFSVTSGTGFVEVDLHARRTLRSVTGSGVAGATLQVDAGGLFLPIAQNGTIAGPDDEGFTLDGNVADLPGVTAARFRLTTPRVTPGITPAVTPGVSQVTVRSAPSNVSARLGSLPPFWTRVGDLAGEETTPDFTAVLQEALRDAPGVNGSKEIDVVVHSDTLCRLDVTCAVEYVRTQSALPAGLAEATLAFDHASFPAGTPASVAVELPVGATVAPGATAGRLAGAFESSRVLAGALGPLAPDVFVTVAPARSQAHPIEAAGDERITAIDLLLRAAPAGASVDLTLVADADGKPWDQPLLARPVNVRVERAPSGAATWLSAALPQEVRLDAGRRYWVVLQCLEGEAEWAAEPAPAGSPGLQTSLDGGLSWRPATAVGTTGLLGAFVRLRKAPAGFEMPVRIEVGAPERVDVDHGIAAIRGHADLVTLDRFAPLGRLELALDFPELGAALGTVATRAAVAACPEGEQLANGDFSSWLEETGSDDEGSRQRAEHWQLTTGRIINDGAMMGSETERTGLSQVVPAAGGCRYALTVDSSGGAPEHGAGSAVELLWTGGAEVRTDTLTLASPVGAEKRDTASAVHTLEVVAPDDATQVEVRFVVPPAAFLTVSEISLVASPGVLSNAALRAEDEDGVPTGWSADPREAVAIWDAGLAGIALGNDGDVEARLSQSAPAEAGSFELELEADVPDDVAAPPRLEVEWLDATEAPAAGAPMVETLAPGSFDRIVLRGDVPAGAATARVAFVLPPAEPEAVLVRRVALSFPATVTIPVTFVADAPGELTLSDPRVTYDLAPASAPAPPGGLWPATPPGETPAPAREEKHAPTARRVTRVLPGDGMTVGPRGGHAVPASAVRGIGPRREETLASAGVASAQDLAATPPETVAALLRVGLPSARAMVAEAGAATTGGTRVDWIDKPFRFDPRQRIHAVGGVEPDGGHWRLTQEDASAAVEAGKLSLYVEAPAGDRVEVVVARRRNRKYLKTEADGDLPNNLLSLPDFPPEAVADVARQCEPRARK